MNVYIIRNINVILMQINTPIADKFKIKLGSNKMTSCHKNPTIKR